MFTHSEKIEHFWDLELLGIKEPTEKTSREEVVKFFNDTLSTDFDGRYMVRLPWTDNSSLPDNKNCRKKDYFRQHQNSFRQEDILIIIQFSKVGKMSRSLKRFLKVEEKEGVIIFLIVEFIKNA
ncbi:hypothetical protein TNIN_393821 [Trichonephila inaurata madagascariensis]|uniref:Uncharacterized protein n=1 Tax=Trichonephila inaurata madagascariensis TaxID=2747483 RepID=A0A8X7CGP5_9ARAC|nr:hypothetical protein TNIN_393821 [Trichonephila inaurata madagascariensis]